MEARTITVLAVAGVLAVVGLVVRQTILRRRERRRASIEQALLPTAYAVLDGAPAPSLKGEEAAVFERLLLRVGRLLREDVRAPLAAYFEQSGAVERERRALRDKRPWRRATAASLLGELGSRAVCADLVAALGDPSEDVRMAAGESLGRLQLPDSVVPLLRAMATGRLARSVGCAAVVEIGSPACPHLLEYLRAADAEGRVNAAQLLGEVGDAGATAPLLALLHDAEPAVRVASARALQRVADATAASALAAALDDTNPRVRAAAATALGRIGGDAALDRLIEVAAVDSFEPARAAAEAAARLDPRRVTAAAGSGPHLREAADRIALL